jgi:predicted alternative tryptophan synthase beta-subunit
VAMSLEGGGRTAEITQTAGVGQWGEVLSLHVLLWNMETPVEKVQTLRIDMVCMVALVQSRMRLLMPCDFAAKGAPHFRMIK